MLSFLLTYLIRHLALRYKILDFPNKRSSHLVPTPRGGGLAIVFTWYIGISILFLLKFINSNLYFALISGVLLAIISLIDDLIRLKPFIRLFVQIFTAIVAFVFLKGINPVFISGIEINAWFLLYPVAIMGIAWFINVFNFLDGIDGYASIEALTIAFVMYIFTGNSINFVLMACVLGFLYWNWPKAKIFMGDVGSTQLGFILIVLGIHFHNGSELSIIHWLMLSSPFWFDATYTLLRRLKNKEQLSQPHKKHVYQRFVQAGYSHSKANFYLIIVNAFIVLLILLSKSFEILLIPLFLLNILCLYWLTLQVDKKIPFN